MAAMPIFAVACSHAKRMKRCWQQCEGSTPSAMFVGHASEH